tara:strand:+ start:102 stop:659 length:558 start_codon:yes stop_codon:yes gene_type:complete
MVLLTFSFTGENTTGLATFTLAKEYKFKNLYLEDIKYNIFNEKLEKGIDKSTSGAGLGSVTTTITSPLAVQMDFLDTKDVVLYSLGDGSGETLNTAQNITGLITIGYAGKVGSQPVSTRNTMSHAYPYKLISNRPQTWESGKTLIFELYYRDVLTDGLIKDWAKMAGTTDAFSDINSISITLRLE